MRAAAWRSFLWSAFASLGFASAACAASDSTAPQGTVPPGAAPPPAYHLKGYYRLTDQIPTWQISDNTPWQVVKGEPWIKPRLVKWGYVPMTHDAKRYYCLIDDRPRTGSLIMEQTFVCGDPETVEWMFNTGRSPRLPLYGGGH